MFLFVKSAINFSVYLLEELSFLDRKASSSSHAEQLPNELLVNIFYISLNRNIFIIE